MDISRLLDVPSTVASKAEASRLETCARAMRRNEDQLTTNSKRSAAASVSATGGKLSCKKRRKSRLSAKQLREKTQREADNSELLNLTLDVDNLQQQVRDCLVQKSLWETRLLIAREQFHARSLRSVGHFFHLFQSGYPEVLSVGEKRFLAALLDESISVGGGVRGQVQFLEQWRRYKKLFGVRRVSTYSIQIVSSDSAGCLIECMGAFEGCVTVAALQSVFPYALGDKALIDRVQHRRFVCPTKTLITLDASGRLVQFDANADVFKAMSQLLDFDLHRLAMLMKNAVISEGSLLPPVAPMAEGDGGEYYLDACRGEPVCDNVDSPPPKIPSRNSVEFLLS